MTGLVNIPTSSGQGFPFDKQWSLVCAVCSQRLPFWLGRGRGRGRDLNVALSAFLIGSDDL